jgi:hypothetical protein
MDILSWLMDRGYCVDWRRDPWLVVTWYSVICPQQLTPELVRDLARDATRDMGRTVMANHDHSPAYTSFDGTDRDGHSVRCGMQLDEMHSLSVWKNGTHDCNVLIIPK